MAGRASGADSHAAVLDAKPSSAVHMLSTPGGAARAWALQPPVAVTAPPAAARVATDAPQQLAPPPLPPPFAPPPQFAPPQQPPQFAPPQQPPPQPAAPPPLLVVPQPPPAAPLPQPPPAALPHQPHQPHQPHPPPPAAHTSGWGDAEEQKLWRLIQAKGRAWTAIAVEMGPRYTDNTVKNRFYSALRVAERRLKPGGPALHRELSFLERMLLQGDAGGGGAVAAPAAAPPPHRQLESGGLPPHKRKRGLAPRRRGGAVGSAALGEGLHRSGGRAAAAIAAED